MATPPAIPDEDIALLDELSQLAMAMSRDLQARCLAVEAARDAADLALGFQRSSRSVRQTIALKAKLRRDQVQFGREDHAHAVRETETRMLVRKAQVRLSVERSVWNEADGPEAERLLDGLDDILEAETFNDAFLQGDVHTHVARICQDLGVTPPADAAAEDDPSGEPSPAPDSAGDEIAQPAQPRRQSSA